MESTRTRTAGEIRAAVRSLGSRGPGRRYPEPLKRDVLRYLDERRGDGAGRGTVSEELGIPERSLKLWESAPRPTGRPAFVTMAVGSAAPVATSGSTSIIVHGPGGLRIEGLGVADVAALLRRLT